MKFVTSIDTVLNDPDLMLVSKDVAKMYDDAKNTKARRSRNFKDNIIRKRIMRKLKDPSSIKGICVCPDHILCDHRKAYIREALYGGTR